MAPALSSQRALLAPPEFCVGAPNSKSQMSPLSDPSKAMKSLYCFIAGLGRGVPGEETTPALQRASRLHPSIPGPQLGVPANVQPHRTAGACLCLLVYDFLCTPPSPTETPWSPPCTPSTHSQGLSEQVPRQAPC